MQTETTSNAFRRKLKENMLLKHERTHSMFDLRQKIFNYLYILKVILENRILVCNNFVIYLHYVPIQTFQVNLI